MKKANYKYNTTLTDSAEKSRKDGVYNEFGIILESQYAETIEEIFEELEIDKREWGQLNKDCRADEVIIHSMDEIKFWTDHIENYSLSIVKENFEALTDNDIKIIMASAKIIN